MAPYMHARKFESFPSCSGLMTVIISADYLITLLSGIRWAEGKGVCGLGSNGTQATFFLQKVSRRVTP